MNKLIIAFALSLTACFTVPFDTPASIRMEVETGEPGQLFEWRELVTIAVDNWHRALADCGDVLPFKMDNKNGKYPVVLKELWPEEVMDVDLRKAGGVTINDGLGNGYVWVRRWLADNGGQEGDRDARLITTMHELGHLMNLEHTDQPGDIMYGGDDGHINKISANDIELAKYAIGCL